MVMMSLMNPSIDASVDGISTAKGYAVSRWLADSCFSSCVSNDRCGEFRSSVSQDSSRSRSLPRSISASLTVVYSDNAGVVPKGNLRQTKLACLLLQCMSTRLSHLYVSGVRLRPGLFFFNKDSFCWPFSSHC